MSSFETETMPEPLISFITAVYNKADVLAETLRLLRAQRQMAPDEMEFVFVDDGSTDGSLALLQGEAARDPRVKVFASERNSGPAIALNQAAKRASGHYLLALDADDMVPANAARFLIESARRLNVPLVFGRSRRGEGCPDIPENAFTRVVDDALAFAAQRKIVRMGFLVERTLWERAGGADEAVFIQDQSLPLRLAAKAGRMAYVDALIYHLRPAGDKNLSRNVLQQHHDRFFALWPFLNRPDISGVARKAILRQIVSSLWKMERDGGRRLPIASAYGLSYLLSRLFGFQPSAGFFRAAGARLRALPNIRRPERPV